MPNPAVLLLTVIWRFPLNVDNPDLNPDQRRQPSGSIVTTGWEFANDLRAQAAQQQCFGILS